jgi:hypothetical protein
MRYKRMPIEVESPEEFGYGKIRLTRAFLDEEGPR